MKLTYIAALLVSLLIASLLLGCGNSRSSCSQIAALNVSPATATADHSAAPPGNTQQFLAFEVAPPGCVTTQSSSVRVTWSVSDLTNVTIGSTPGSSNYGLATCVDATSGPVTVTANLPASLNAGTAVSGTATLTCN